MSGRSAEELRTSAGQEKLREAIREAVSERLIAEVPSLEATSDQEEGETEEKKAASEPPGPVRGVLLPNFIIQAR